MICFGILLAVFAYYPSHATRAHHDVYWNSSNPLFEPFDNAIDTPGYYELPAKPLDIVKFHCPRRRAKEFSLIYKVSLEEFERCSLGKNAELIASCDGEHPVVRHTLVQDQFQPGQLYYITTSSGKKEGLQDRRLGLCNEKNMRMAIQRHDPLLTSDVDLQRLMQDRFYLAEENGELNWKKNVLPDIDFDWRTYLQNQNRKLKFDKSIQIEPIPLDDEFFNRWEQLRNQHEDNELGFLIKAEEAIIADTPSSGGTTSLTLTLVSALFAALQWLR
ncbi:unnamed protein product [Heligmosomoides polygyrus]|uniref:Ephrin RBD domain-containing protein n=1 Tax=Heligmosomoides polygyrus TaxID=6339 RepID=A0A183FTE0_HELPZ|nr:unnamed protein product [Heligmosomoides polygyrus]